MAYTEIFDKEMGVIVSMAFLHRLDHWMQKHKW